MMRFNLNATGSSDLSDRMESSDRQEVAPYPYVGACCYRKSRSPFPQQALMSGLDVAYRMFAQRFAGGIDLLEQDRIAPEVCEMLQYAFGVSTRQQAAL